MLKRLWTFENDMEVIAAAKIVIELPFIVNATWGTLRVLSIAEYVSIDGLR